MNTEENDSLNSAGSGGALLDAGGNLVGTMSAERTVALCARMNEWYLSLDVSGQNGDVGMLLFAVMSIPWLRQTYQQFPELSALPADGSTHASKMRAIVSFKRLLTSMEIIVSDDTRETGGERLVNPSLLVTNKAKKG